jgi:hypothetical protein
MEELESGALYYRLDADDRICEVGGPWDEFARANEGERLLSERVIGTDFYSYISGDISRMYVRTIFGGVRALNREATRTYRCDSPNIKRFMEMTVRPESGGNLHVAHRLLRTEPLPATFRFVGHAGKGSDFIVRCSMCNRLKLRGHWCEPEVFREHGPEFPEGAAPVIYGVCSACFDGLRGTA